MQVNYKTDITNKDNNRNQSPSNQPIWSPPKLKPYLCKENYDSDNNSEYENESLIEIDKKTEELYPQYNKKCSNEHNEYFPEMSFETYEENLAVFLTVKRVANFKLWY